jgi:hypothetical protein
VSLRFVSRRELPDEVLRMNLSGCLVVGLTLGLVSCSTGPAKTTSTDAASGSPTAGTQPQSGAGAATPQLSAAERQRRGGRLRTYFLDRAKQTTIVATTRTESGQIIDWIRPESQLPSGAKFAQAPPTVRPRTPPQYATRIATYTKPDGGREQLARTEIQAQPRARGPKGTVPVVRFNVDAYLEGERDLPERPEDVLKKVPPPSPDSNSRYYGVWQRFDTFFGTSGRINIWDVSGPNSAESSIAQTAVIRGTPMQAIEAGKIELSTLNGDDRPHFFVYFRTNGSASGDWVGGYNTLVKGWIQVSSSVAPGMSLANWASTVNGNQYSLDLEVRLWNGNWWVRAAGEWAGYYPMCNGGGGFSPCSAATLFSAAGIRDKADRLDWYGEVFDSSAPAPTTTDMGSGRLASEGWGKSAYFRNLTFFWQPATYWWWDSGSASATDSACYSVTGPFYSQVDAWHNWYYFGGPGKDEQGCK